MNSSIFAALVALAAAAGPAGAVDFTGPQAPANWTVGNVGTLIGGTLGTAAFSTTQLVLTGSNSSLGCVGGTYGFLTSPCQTQVSLAGAGNYTFSWSYLTSDPDGPAGDIFGALVDSTRIQLSDPGGPIAQSGTRTFHAVSSFGWFVNCTDCTGGSATATISNFNVAAVPEPETYALMMGGLAALALIARRRRSK